MPFTLTADTTQLTRADLRRLTHALIGDVHAPLRRRLCGVKALADVPAVPVHD